MKSMRLMWCLLLATIARPGGAAEAPELEPFVAVEEGVAWSSDLPGALARAQQAKRLVLVNFTAGDGCGACQRLREQILSKKPFRDFAREKLVLVEVPCGGADDADDRREWRERHGVKDLPTVLLLDGDGRELGRTGYMQGGAKTFVRELKRFAAKAEPAATAKP